MDNDNLETGYKKWVQKGKTALAIVTSLTVLGCNIATKNIAVSIGPDASDVGIDSKGNGFTKYSPDKPKLVFFGGTPYTYYSGYWNGSYFNPGYYPWSSSYPYINPYQCLDNIQLQGLKNDLGNGSNGSYRNWR